MNPFTAAIVSLIRGQLADLASPPEIPEGLVERPPDSGMGDYAFPCFVLAKALRKAPPAIAQQLAAALAAEVAAHPLLRSVEAAGPYLNFRVDPAEMARRTLPAILDGSYFRRNAEAPR
ncbi:MAG: hypothetical protein O7A67_11475, partial [SAR324 cluster bacterium]|nr:hypothetical protein [SAR324 cluster bacterium]